jgi:aspartyl-tRNA(Asn)/glutamyl-tRNA(Gln) amidotransferase subunit A
MSKLDITELSALETQHALKNKEFSAVELTEAFLEKMEAHKSLNAFVAVTEEIALTQAQESDKRIAAGNTRALEGIPFAIKDLFCTKGVRTTSSSHILKDFVPEYESTVTSRLWENGAIMLGKTNMDEFAMGSTNITSNDGIVVNPHKRIEDDTDLVPGGSSGGSAAAMAARLCIGATGSDTGGSIRQPASFCGLVGIKPTYGRCSRYGMIAFASSLDQAGVFAHNTRDAALFLDAICGHDPRDSTTVELPSTRFLKTLDEDHNIKGLKVGIPKQYRVDGMPKEIEQLWHKGATWLKDHGAEIVDIELPHTHYSLATYYIIAPAEASSNLARYDGVRYGLREMHYNASLDEMYEETRASGFGDEVKRRIMIGTYVLSAGYYDAYYTQAQKVRRLISQDFKQAFQNVDVILTPTTPSPAFAIGENMDDPIQMYLNDVFTVPASLAGLPAMSVPAGLSEEGLPLGLQLIANSFCEQNIFKCALAIEMQQK